MSRSVIVLAVAIIGLLILLSGAGSSAAAGVFFEPCGQTHVAATIAEAPSDITTNFGIGLDPSTCGQFVSPEISPSQYDWQKLVYFTPNGWTIAGAADIPDGTPVGKYKTRMTMGILNNPCNIVLNVNYDLFDGTIDQSNPVDAKPAGSHDALAPMAADTNANQVPDAADRWPSYLSSVAAKEGIDPSQLVARYVGVNNRDVAGTTMVVNFLVFKPGAKLSNTFLVDSRLGYPMVLVMQDPTSQGSDQDPVTTVCAPFWTELNLDATAAGTTLRGNPGNGTYDFVTMAIPQPDANDDGIENRGDPCPYTEKSNWDPRGQRIQPGGDSDGDGLPDACDPHPNEASTGVAGSGIAASDEEHDGWANRIDNCPLLDNPDQADSDGDGIGDMCDQYPSVVDGDLSPVVCLVSPVTIGTGGPAPTDPQNMSPCSVHLGCLPSLMAGVCTVPPSPTPSPSPPWSPTPSPSPTPPPSPTPSPSPLVTAARLPDAGGAPRDGDWPWPAIGLLGAAVLLFGLGFVVARRRLSRIV